MCESEKWKWSRSVVTDSLRPWLFATPWTEAYQAPPSMGFSRQEYWNGVPLPSLEEGKYPTWAHSGHPVSTKMGKEKPWTSVRLTVVQKHRLMKGLRPNHRSPECFSSPHLTTTLLKAYLLLWVHHVWLPGAKRKLQDILKGKKHNLKREQASEPDVAEMLELEHDFKTTMMNMLRALIRYSKQHAITDGHCKQRQKS